jgi:K+-transporting ATPase A subunit
MTILALLSLPLSILGWTALATVLPAGIAGIANTGPHGFSEILYAFTSTTANNGSAFAGLSANTWYYNLTLAGAMLMGRFIFVIPLLAVAGSLARRTSRSASNEFLRSGVFQHRGRTPPINWIKILSWLVDLPPRRGPDRRADWDPTLAAILHDSSIG